MIDVIIPAYNSHDTIEKTLYSISYQTIKDKLRVYIVNDASENDYSEMVNYFSNFINIQELKLEKNSGPGVARQYGIDHSNSEYIIFIDSDDVFFDCFSIKKLYDTIVTRKCDVVIGNFVEEVQSEFFSHNEDTIWLHGKIYKRKYIEENNIRFNDTRLNEDNGFNQLIFLGNSNISYLDYNVYIWCNNLKSITRKDNHSVLFELLLGYIYNINWALQESLKRKYDTEKISSLAISALVAIYIHYIDFEKNKESKKILELAKPIKEIFDNNPIEIERKYDIMEAQYLSLFKTENKKCLFEPSITFNDFLKLVSKV